VHQGSHLAVKQQASLLQQRLGELSVASENVAELKRLQEELTVISRKEEIQAECTAIEATVGSLLKRAKDSLNELYQLDEQWNDIHRKLEIAGKKISGNEASLQLSMQDEQCSTSQRIASIQVRIRLCRPNLKSRVMCFNV
jgi:DNA repair ATPase RecN